MSSWLSILIPAFNVEDYLAATLDSIIPQADEGIEIIILDDASYDQTNNIIQSFAMRYPQLIRIIQHEHNQGISIARNHLIAAAKGTYCWFIDSDDLIQSTAIEKLKKIIAEKNPDIIQCDYFLWLPESNRRRKIEHKKTFLGAKNKLIKNTWDIFKGTFAQAKLHLWTRVIRRDVLLQAPSFPSGKYFEDAAILPRILLNTQSLYYTPDPWVWYRQREGSILSQQTENKTWDMSAAMNGVLAEWKNKYETPPQSAQLSFVKYCDKIFRFSLKNLKKDNSLNHEKIARLRQDFYSATHLSKRDLRLLYLRTGNIVSLIRLMKYL